MDLSDQIIDLERRLQDASRNEKLAERRHAQSKRDLQSKITVLTNTLAEKEAELCGLKESQKRGEENTYLIQRNKDLEAALVEQAQDGIALSRFLQEMEEQLIQRDNELVTMNDRLSELEAREDNTERVMTEMRILEESHQKKEEEITQLRSRLDMAERQSQASKEEMVVDREHSAAQAEGELSLLQDENGRQRKKIAKLRSMLETIGIAQEKQEKQAAENKVHTQQQAASYQTTVELLKAKCDALERERNEVYEETRRKNEILENNKTYLTETIQKNEELTSRNEVLYSKIIQSDSMHSEAAIQLAVLKQELMRIAQTNVQLNGDEVVLSTSEYSRSLPDDILIVLTSIEDEICQLRSHVATQQSRRSDIGTNTVTAQNGDSVCGLNGPTSSLPRMYAVLRQSLVRNYPRFPIDRLLSLRGTFLYFLQRSAPLVFDPSSVGAEIILIIAFIVQLFFLWYC